MGTALRADAKRNRERVLVAARAVFARQGLEAGVDEIAREAGVGVGTLYRRFATKDHLILAIVEDGMGVLFEEINAAAMLEDPWEGLETAMLALAESMAADRGFVDAVREHLLTLPAFLSLRDRLLSAWEPLVARGREAGVLRHDVEPLDLLLLARGVVRMPPDRDDVDPRLWRRYMAIVLDGLHAGGTGELPVGPPQPAR
ncbi:MAG: TetR/AcrR family transcriptional regulator [Solirubrobacteraceae bacterium MAG38_C4-C5]|nr:TetR/AcrR family transcriptional regulator [Candidatus Siliceabacter maunaloa]